jgi:hypothetical protein
MSRRRRVGIVLVILAAVVDVMVRWALGDVEYFQGQDV